MRLKVLPPEAKPAPQADGARVSRLYALDSMRALFSVVVVIGHFGLALPLPIREHEGLILMLTPLRFGWAFVITFFMLSGFVLALPFTGPKPPTYGVYLVKRISRLYVPFAAIIALTYLLYALVGVTPEFTNGMIFHAENLDLPPHFTLWSFVRTLAMTGLRRDIMPDPAIWSLVHEMRISLFFPLLIWLCRRPWAAVAFMAGCYGFVYFAQYSFASYAVFPALTDDYMSSWLSTIYITPCFMFGILLAAYGEKLRNILADQSDGVRALLWILVFVNFSFIPDLYIHQPFTEFGSALMILLVLSSDMIADLAQNRVTLWLGQISYSTYLVHLPILFALRSVWEGKVNLAWLFAACFVLTFPVATLAQRFIEVPSRKLAKRILHRSS